MTRPRSVFLRLLAVTGAVALVAAIPQPAAAQPGPADAPAQPTGTTDAGFLESETGLWVVQLTDASLATYTGGVPGLAATSPQATGERQLDVSAPDSVAYRDYLAGRQAEAQAALDQALGRSVTVTHRYLNVVNGLVVEADAAEAAQLEALPEVVAVYRDVNEELVTDASHDLIGSASFWDGDVALDQPTRGEGVVVGVIDTGVNPDHPSFAAVDGDGYGHLNPFGSGTFAGVCDPADPAHDPICNDKLIGAYNLHPDSPDARDANGHGSHTASTAAGNRHEASINVGGDDYVRTVQGVANRANIISYLVCFPSCPRTSSVQAVEHALEDGVDVLNYSISGPDDPWEGNIVSLAFLEATGAGIFVSAAAGNSGPGAGTVHNTGPWNATVAASTTNRAIAHPLDVTSPEPVPPELQGLRAVPGSPGATVVEEDLTAEIRYAGAVDPGNEVGCDPFPAGAFADSIALIDRGVCTFPEKVANAAAAGAVAMVLANNSGGPPPFMGGLVGAAIPGVALDQTEGTALRDFVLANSPVEVEIGAQTALVFDDDWQDVVAGFSSRGPNPFADVLAPSVAAPGVGILAASMGAADSYAFLNGTSMATPHTAGAAALLAAHQPNWSPVEHHSALAGTAANGLRKEDGSTAADVFDVGSGRIDLTRAGHVGLVLDETEANFADADPSAGGDPTTLNLPALVDANCISVCTFTRTVKNRAMVEATYEVVVDAPAGMTVTVEPSEFTLTAGNLNGDTQELEITVDVGGLPVGDWVNASITIETDAVNPTHGDFVQLGQIVGPVSSWEPRSVDLRGYAGQEVCLAFAYKGFNAHTWRVDDVLVESDDGVHIDESFDDPDAFPPAGWSRFDFDGVGNQWAHTTTANTAPGATQHAFSTTDGLVQDGWLVTPSFTVGDNPSATFFDFTQFVDWYVHSGVWVSTGDCDPTPSDGPAVEPVTFPVTVVPENLGPIATVDPTSLSSTQSPNEQVTQELTIGNEGDQDLLWSVVQGSPAQCEVPDGTPWADVDPLLGVVPPEGSQTVEVTFDSTGLVGGDLREAVLCLGTNDPASPLTEVALSLEVVEIPVIDVTPGEFDVTVTEGQTAQENLTIGNIGEGILNWTIATEETAPAGPRLPTGATPVTTAPDSGAEPGRGAAMAPSAGGGSTFGLPSGGLGGTAPANPVQTPQDEVTLTHSVDPTTVQPLLTPACANAGPPQTTRDTQYLRHFILADFGITDPFTPTGVEFGVETLSTPATVTVNLHAWDPDTGFDYPNFELIGSTDVPLTPPVEQQLVQAPVAVDRAVEPDEGLVFEVVVPDLLGVGTYFGGSNSAGETADSFVASDTCGIPSPVTMASIGFADAHLVKSVTGDTGAAGCTPTDVPWLSADPDSGSTAAGDSSQVAVTFDATDLEPGEYEALLCVESDDPDNSRVEVPVNLTVEEAEVGCDVVITGRHDGDLTVSSGVTCLAAGAQVLGSVNVQSGAGLVATAAVIQGPVTAIGATVVDLAFTQVTGPMVVAAGTGVVSLFGNQVTGGVSLSGNSTAGPATVSGNTIIGTLSCLGNSPDPTDLGLPNTATGGKLGQCADL